MFDEFGFTGMTGLAPTDGCLVGCGICCTDRALLAYHFTPLSYLVIYSLLKMEANCFSETSVNIRRTIRRHIPLYNLKSYTVN